MIPADAKPSAGPDQPNQPVAALRFGAFQVNLRSGELHKHGIRIKLQDQPFQVLASLLEHPGEVVTREELRSRLWQESTHGDFDHCLNISVNKLRDALGDSAENPRYIETIPRRGYRFLYPVEAVERPRTPPLPAAPASTTRASLGKPPIRITTRRLLLPALALTAALVFLAYLGASRLGWRGGPPRKPMLAVLPFENLTQDPAEEYFIAGLNEEMIAQMGRLRPSSLAVIAPASVKQYMHQPKTMEEIGRELQADYILAGSVRRAGDRVRISARLVDVHDRTYLWGETYDRKLSDIFAVQTEVADRVAGALRLELSTSGGDGEAAPPYTTKDMDAYDAYLLGRYALGRRTRESFEQAIHHFEAALAEDPDYSLAYAGLADAYNLLGGYNYLPPEKAFPRAKQMATKALQLNPSLAPAYTSLAFASFHYDWDWATAERFYRRALELDPNYAVAREWYAEFLHARGRLDEALAEAQRARETDPLSRVLADVTGWTWLSKGDNERAIQQFQRAHEIDPHWPKAYFSLSFAYARSGRFDLARQELEKVRGMVGDTTTVQEYLGYIQALSGQRDAARMTLGRLQDESRKTRVSLYSLALIHTALGENDQAISLLERARAEHDNWVVWLKVLPEWSGLDPDPRFQQLLRRIGLEP